MPTIAVYGSLKRGGALNPILRGCEFLGSGVTCRLFAMRSAGAYPFIFHPGSGVGVPGRVRVELYRVDDPDLLDRLDGIEVAYDRTPVRVLVGDEIVDAEIYVGRGKPREYLKRMTPDDRGVHDWPVRGYYPGRRTRSAEDQEQRDA